MTFNTRDSWSELTSRNLVSVQVGLQLEFFQPTGKCHTDNSDLRVGFGLGLGKFSSVIEREADIGIRGATSDLRTLDITCTVDDDLENTDGGVERGTGKHLLEIEGEEVWVVHHGCQGAMDHVPDECRKSRNLVEG